MDGAQGAPALVMDKQGILPWARTAHSPPSMSRGDLCAGELLRGKWLTQDSNPDWIPSPHPRGGAEGGWGLYCGPAAWPEVVGNRTASLTPPRGSLAPGVWRCCVRPAVPRPDPGFLCGSGHRPAVSGPVSHLPSRLGSTRPRPRHGVMGRAGPSEADPTLPGMLAPAGPAAGLASLSKQDHPSRLCDGLSLPPLAAVPAISAAE